ncbi:hypothetical protein C9374_009792 [Naegleria lovaniensis]|uniref:F-box domain-containing protein n=1 Tax=Naegleria lovaniensis TaxID=51637 RepID=A0AA88GYB2_NAELO|nr:uncharacterized protein C9374_009792 [Naegleria lovaniensis]KAG2393215.1 hypothetical protein C9374_009792 [Naegleria lovaniensis]
MNKLEVQLSELIKTTISEEYKSSSSSISLNRIQYLSILDHLETIIKKQKQEYLWELIQHVPMEVMVGNICPYLPLGFLLNGSMFLVCKRWYEGIYESEGFWRLVFTRLWNGFIKTRTRWNEISQNDHPQEDEYIRDLNEVSSDPSDFNHETEKFTSKMDWKYLRKYCMMRRRRFLEADQPFISYKIDCYRTSINLDMMKNYSKFFDCFYLKSLRSDQQVHHFGSCSNSDEDGYCYNVAMRLDCFNSLSPTCIAVYVFCNVSSLGHNRARVAVDIDAEKIMTLSDDDDNDDSTMNNDYTHHSHRLQLYSFHILSYEVDRFSRETVNYLNEENMSKVRAWFGSDKQTAALKNHEWLYVLFASSSLEILKEMLRSHFVPLNDMNTVLLDKMVTGLSSNELSI